MATEKDFVKRIVKEMVDYYLYHDLAFFQSAEYRYL